MELTMVKEQNIFILITCEIEFYVDEHYLVYGNVCMYASNRLTISAIAETSVLIICRRRSTSFNEIA